MIFLLLLAEVEVGAVVVAGAAVGSGVVVVLVSDVRNTTPLFWAAVKERVLKAK